MHQTQTSKNILGSMNMGFSDPQWDGFTAKMDEGRGILKIKGRRFWMDVANERIKKSNVMYSP